MTRGGVRERGLANQMFPVPPAVPADEPMRVRLWLVRWSVALLIVASCAVSVAFSHLTSDRSLSGWKNKPASADQQAA